MKQTLGLIVALLVLSGCRQPTEPPPAHVPVPDTSRPVVQYWDGGIHMAGKPSFVLFAAWADGMVVKRVDDKAMSGVASPQEISKLVLAIRGAGFFSPSGSSLLNTYGMVFPDGPVKCLSVLNGANPRTLYYHGRDDLEHLDQIGPNAEPSRGQCETFIKMWKRVVAEIEHSTPDKLEPFTGNRNLTYPQYNEKSQHPPAN